MEIDAVKPSKRCFNCHRRGHLARECRQRKKISEVTQWPSRRTHRPTRGQSEIVCLTCKQLGHIAKDCPTRRGGFSKHLN